MVLLIQGGACPCSEQPLLTRVSLYDATDADLTTGSIPAGRASLWNTDSQHDLTHATAFLNDPKTAVLSVPEPRVSQYMPFQGQDFPRARNAPSSSTIRASWGLH